MMQRRIPIEMQPRHVAVALAALAAFLFAFTLAAAPGLHEYFHTDAAQSHHECAVTIVESGKYESSQPAPVLCCPTLPVNYSTIAALTFVWVPAPFLSASILEHAPPVLS